MIRSKMLKISLIIVNWLGLTLLGAFRPETGSVSWAELHRQAQAGSKKAKRQIKRIQALTTVLSLQKIMHLGLAVSLLGLLFSQISWWSMAVWLLLVVASGWVGKLAFVRRIASRLYAKVESKVLKVIKKAPVIPKILDSLLVEDLVTTWRVSSKEELKSLIEGAGEVLDEKDRQRLASGLVFASQKVATVMVPREKIDFLRRNEFLGPLTLDDLHRRGHSQFPIIGRDLDQVIGLLDIADLLSLDIKKSAPAEKIMSKKVYYVDQNDSLEEALTVCLDKKAQLLIVTNQQKQTVGLVTLRDIIEVLLGYSVLDIEPQTKKDN